VRPRSLISFSTWPLSFSLFLFLLLSALLFFFFLVNSFFLVALATASLVFLIAIGAVPRRCRCLERERGRERGEVLHDLRSDLLAIAPSARPLALRILLCVVPHHIDSCRPTPFDSVARSWCLLPLLQLLLALLRSAEAPGELHTCDCGL